MRNHSQPKYEVVDIIDAFKSDFLKQYSPNSYDIRTLNALQICRSATLGGHQDKCDSCGHIRISYNSCRNRHCPKCQNTNRESWIDKQKQNLLPVVYFHVVFTVPDALNTLFLSQPKKMYNLLFKTAWNTIDQFSLFNRQSETGMIAVLHSWGQSMSLHPHLHCIIPGGGIHYNGKWNPVKKSSTGKSFLFEVKQLSEVFRGKFIDALKKEMLSNDSLTTELYKHQWVVYSKDSFAGPEQIIEYLARYSHKIAISNHRIVSIENNTVNFKYRDYRDNKQKIMSLSGVEFLRRFCMHILPKQFVRIRHFGILSSTKRQVLKEILLSLNVDFIPATEKKNWKEICREKLNFDPDICPHCKKGHMIMVEKMMPIRAPPSFRNLLQAASAK
jgi:hypothetical protein